MNASPLLVSPSPRAKLENDSFETLGLVISGTISVLELTRNTLIFLRCQLYTFFSHITTDNIYINSQTEHPDLKFSELAVGEKA